MWISKLELKNFQKHSDLKLNFTSGVNVIYGATDAGKSCIKRAISWVFFNTPQGDVVRKEDTKKTSVKVTLNNDVVVERIKSASINAYILLVGDEEKRFDSVGRKIPEEVVEALRTSLIDVNDETINLNIADQIALPFLLDKSGTFRSKLFNKLTGSEITDKVLQDLNKDILRVGREGKIIKEELEQKEQQEIKIRIDVNGIKEKYNKLDTSFESLKQIQDKYTRLQDLNNKLEKNKSTTVDIKSKINKIGAKGKISIDKLREKQNKLDRLTKLDDSINNNISLLGKIKQKIAETKDFSKLPVNKLRAIWERLDIIKKMKNKLEQNSTKIKDIKTKKELTKKVLIKWVSRYKEELKKRDICPTCKQTITEKTIKNLKVI